MKIISNHRQLREKQMMVKNADGGSDEDVRLLNHAFISFREATQRLQKYYGHLEETVEELNLELRKKNRELKKNLQEKEEVKNYLNNILESLSTGVIVVDLQGNITTFNKTARKITGLSFKQVRGKGFDSVFCRFFSEGAITFELLKGLDEDLGIETTIAAKDKSVLQVKLSSSPVKSPKGKVTGFMVLLQDITNVKRLEEQIQRTNRLAAMGEIAVRIAHEVRNPLGTIELFVSLLRKDLAKDENGGKVVDQISTAVRSLDQIVSNLLIFTNRQKAIFHEIDVHKYLDDSLLFTSHIMKQGNIKLTKRYSFRPLVIRADKELLKQVFLNIILNAVQSMSHGGTLTITTRVTRKGLRLGTWEPNDYAALIKSANHEFVEIRFADKGVGISEADKGSIFSPFFTTKERGTGLGLAIVHNILESHGGTIEVASELGKGSIFTVSLPAVADSQKKEISDIEGSVVPLFKVGSERKLKTKEGSRSC